MVQKKNELFVLLLSLSKEVAKFRNERLKRVLESLRRLKKNAIFKREQFRNTRNITNSLRLNKRWNLKFSQFTESEENFQLVFEHKNPKNVE